MTRQIRGSSVVGLGLVVLAGLMTACGGSPTDSVETSTSTAALDSSSAAVPMIVYSPQGGPIDESGFINLGNPENLGGQTIQGTPQIYARIDFSQNGMTAGLFKATTGKIRVTFPFTEHATILEGEVTITDATGQSHTFKPGDSYLIHQGQVVIWEVTKAEVVKSFFNIVEAQ